MRERTAISSIVVALLAAAVALGTSGATSATTGSVTGEATRAVGQPSILNGNAVTSASEVHLTADQQAALESQVAQALKTLPNAKQVSLNEVEWAEGKVRAVLTFPMPGFIAPLAADCAFMWVCVYEHQDFGYPRQAYFNCGNASIPSGMGVSAWHNNQTNNTASWLLSGAGTSLQNSRALSKISYVGAPSNDLARTIHVC